MSAMLGFFGIRQKALNIGLKCFLGVWRWMIGRRVAHVLIVVCPCVSFGAVQVDLPSHFEFGFLAIGQAPFEVGNYGLQLRKDGVQFVVNGGSIMGPVSRFGVQPLENAEDIGSECFSSGLKGDIPLQLETAKDRDKGGNQDESGSGWDYFQAAILGGLMACVVMIPVFMQKPNV
ncbi:MAG: hypothetical protein KJ787_03055 [Gammaproteobacteria bacterium]|nr:hypothetical protein [Gammaproteobacteria bacterium]MBU1645292.1 hypothetical protein [Gammaproteobacteria bacterium]MBU1971629.1 hypothetical protein [Gammaproteobacteria bacterium]